MIKRLLKKRLIISLPVCFALILAGSFALTVIMLRLQAAAPANTLQCVKDSGGLMLLLNFLPILMSMLLVFFLTGNIVIAGGATGFAVIALSIVNRFKMIFRHDPFMPWDFMLGGEVMGIARSFSTKLIVGTLGGLIIIIAVIAVAFIFIKNKKMSAYVRAWGAVLTLFVMLAGSLTLYSNREINAGLPVVGNIYNEANQFNSKGFVYQFIYTFNTSKIQKPSGYDKRAVEAAAMARLNEPSPAGKKPHVFLILGEGFSELPLSPVLSYDGFTDPLANYKEIKDRSISGELIVPNVGGGTADTEFDMMTGINTRQFRGVPYANTLITKSMNAMPRIMREAGYRAASLHPGFAWFYNRQNVFPMLGFESFTNLSDFEGAPEKGMYVEETVTYDRVIGEYERHIAENPGTPFFSFVITIQNHGPYEGKYKSDINFESSAGFTTKDADALANYIEGVADMDRELGRLVRYMGDMEEPVVVAYFGDHLPLLGQDVYDALIDTGSGSELEHAMRMYRTPFIIWANDAAKPLVNGGAVNGGEKMSSFLFGAALMQYVGVEGYEPFFDFLNEMRQIVPVVTENDYYLTDMAARDKLMEPNETVELYEQWAYYKIFEGR